MIKIISGFAGIGKSTLAKVACNIVDLESSEYKWKYTIDTSEMTVEERKGITERVQDPEWPMNYIQAIKEESENYDYILLCMDKPVRDLLVKEGIEFALAFPSLDSKDEYIERLKNRGNNQAFINLITKNYDKWINDLMEEPQDKMIVRPGEFLADVIGPEFTYSQADAILNKLSELSDNEK